MTIPKVFARDGMVVCAYEGNALEKAYTPRDARSLAERLLSVVYGIERESKAARADERERIKRDLLALYDGAEFTREKMIRAIDGEA